MVAVNVNAPGLPRTSSVVLLLSPYSSLSVCGLKINVIASFGSLPAKIIVGGFAPSNPVPPLLRVTVTVKSRVDRLGVRLRLIGRDGVGGAAVMGDVHDGGAESGAAMTASTFPNRIALTRINE